MNTRYSKWMLVLGLLVLLSACATPPLSTESVSAQLTPTELLLDVEKSKGTVIWGGVIVSSVNLANRTQMEVLAFPLDAQQRPMRTKRSIGRFLLQSPDYIETQDYATGREITVIGTLQGVTTGAIGEADYEYPTVTLKDVHLWELNNTHEKPKFIFGIGLNISG